MCIHTFSTCTLIFWQTLLLDDGAYTENVTDNWHYAERYAIVG